VPAKYHKSVRGERRESADEGENFVFAGSVRVSWEFKTWKMGADLLIMYPTNRPPTALPITDGMR
jgi:hypothetical protein